MGKVQRFTLPSPASRTSDQNSGRKGASILLIEDNRADAILVREALEEHEVEGELITLTDGESAIRFIQQLDESTTPDLILVDLNLPRRSGIEVLEALRENRKCRLTQVVVLSSSDAQEDRARASRLGVTRYIRKPSGLEDFIGLGGIFKELLGGSAQ